MNHIICNVKKCHKKTQKANTSNTDLHMHFLSRKEKHHTLPEKMPHLEHAAFEKQATDPKKHTQSEKKCRKEKAMYGLCFIFPY